MSFDYKPPKKKKSKILNAIKVASDYLPIVTPFGIIPKKVIDIGVKKVKDYKKPKEKYNIQKIINTLKSEKKLSTGSHPGIETQPKRKADFNVVVGNIRKYGKPVPLRPSKEKHPLEKRKPFGGAKFKLMKKGGKIKTYATGSTVRKPKY